MHVALAVKHLHAATDLDHSVEGLLERHRARTHLREQVSHRAVLHDQVRATVARRPHAVQLHDRGVPGEQSHRVGLTVQFLRAALIAQRAHDLDGHVAARQLLTVEEDVGEAALTERAHPSEAGNIRALQARNRGRQRSSSFIVRAMDALRRS